MPDADPRRLFVIRHARLLLRLTAITLLVFGPIALAAWERHGPLDLDPRYVEVRDPAEDRRVAQYLTRRHPALDRLLPAGAGGVRFFERLDDKAGMAFTGAATIGLSVSALEHLWRETVELHERAHLLHAALSDEVAALLSMLPAPSAGEYAARNAGEHFAEMAAHAWELATEPEGICLNSDPLDRLAEAESRVPGTAGFVAYYLRWLPPSGDAVDSAVDRTALAREADRLRAPYRTEWDALERALHARRLGDGTLSPLEPLTLRERLEAFRSELLAGGRMDRLAAAALLPSLAVLAMVGR